LGRGDDGFTDVPNLGRVRKSHPRVEAYGTIDELMSMLGYACSLVEYADVRETITKIQTHLFHISAHLAMGDGERFKLGQWLSELETLMEMYERELEPLRHFIYPGGTPVAAALHICRSVARRAERNIARLMESEEVKPEIPAYLNRLSTLLFTLARVCNKRAGVPDREWVRG